MTDQNRFKKGCSNAAFFIRKRGRGMSELISRQEALNAVSWDTEAYTAINMLPFITERNKGEWKTAYLDGEEHE